MCFNHLNQIKCALGIEGVITSASSWFKKDEDDGAQIDLVITRDDNVVNLCEMKYYSNDYTVTKEYYKNLLNKQELLQKELNNKQVIHNTLITTYGLKKNEYSSFFQNTITLEDLFQ